MTTVVGIRMRPGGRMYYFDPNQIDVKRDDSVIVETHRGLDYGVCVKEAFDIEDEKTVQPLRKVQRIATPDDAETNRYNEEKESKAGPLFDQLVADHKLEMKFVRAEYNFDATKLIIFFTSDGRVDFRDLVKDLASQFHSRIELRQIGVRDEAQMLGGCGICGRPYCCSSFLDEFQPVSIKMAKEQNLSLNPTKISGCCGRLLCCLKYEQAAYEHLNATTPRVDAIVQTPDGPGNVTDVSLLRGNLKVRLHATPDVPPKVYHKSQVEQLKTGPKSRPRRAPVIPPEK
jgi:cell fate regulator YaaT (PSP1 superfamily)